MSPDRISDDPTNRLHMTPLLDDFPGEAREDPLSIFEPHHTPDPISELGATAIGELDPETRDSYSYLFPNEEVYEGPSPPAPPLPPPPIPEGRGTPHPSRSELERRDKYKGEVRVRELTDMFGKDALILGHLLFEVPPLAIRVKKGNITHRWKPLRTKESIAFKSGNGECWIEIDLVFVGLRQMKTYFRELVVLWKKVPFCFVENIHIRKMMIPNDPEDTMAVCLDTLVADTMAGTPNVIYTTLLCQWFNYKPYSHNFWFRRNWTAVDAPLTAATVPTLPSPNPMDYTTLPSPDPRDYQDTGPTLPSPDPLDYINDLSEIEDPSSRILAPSGLPPEERVREANAGNPGDPSIAPTYPVVYPWNSEPFMRRVREGESGVAGGISSWGDSLGMQWTTFKRLQVPRSWAYAAAKEANASAPDRPRDRGTEAATTEVNQDPGRTTSVWTVCSVEDGDTIFVTGTSPTTGNPVVRRIRLQYCDTPETYDEYDVPNYNDGGILALPEGQDSYRPAIYKLGNVAKLALEAKLPRGQRVNISFTTPETGFYGRYLGVVFKGEENLNIWLIRQGYAFASLGDLEGNYEYAEADTEAKDNQRGVYSSKKSSQLFDYPSDMGIGAGLEVKGHLERLMLPSDFRAQYVPSSDGGHGTDLPDPCEGVLEEFGG